MSASEFAWPCRCHLILSEFSNIALSPPLWMSSYPWQPGILRVEKRLRILFSSSFPSYRIRPLHTQQLLPMAFLLCLISQLCSHPQSLIDTRLCAASFSQFLRTYGLVRIQGFGASTGKSAFWGSGRAIAAGTFVSLYFFVPKLAAVMIPKIPTTSYK